MRLALFFFLFSFLLECGRSRAFGSRWITEPSKARCPIMEGQIQIEELQALRKARGNGISDYGSNFRRASDGVQDLGSGRRIANHLRKNRVISVQIDRGLNQTTGVRDAHNVLIKGIQRNSRTGKLRLLIMDPANQIKTQSIKQLNSIHMSHFIVTGI